MPPEVQRVTVFSGGIHAAAKQPEAARALVKFLTAPAAAPVIGRNGLHPG
jgi:molybdate transport system substrate-binding protein